MRLRFSGVKFCQKGGGDGKAAASRLGGGCSSIVVGLLAVGLGAEAEFSQQVRNQCQNLLVTDIPAGFVVVVIAAVAELFLELYLSAIFEADCPRT